MTRERTDERGVPRAPDSGVRGMETLESSRVCRLCGQHSGISINIFDKSENHLRKINAVLPIMVRHVFFLFSLFFLLSVVLSRSSAYTSARTRT